MVGSSWIEEASVRACVHVTLCIMSTWLPSSWNFGPLLTDFSFKWNGEQKGWFLYKIPTFIILCKGNTALEQARCDLQYSLCFSTCMWCCLRPFNHHLKHFHTLFNSSFKLTSICLYKQWLLFTKKIIVWLPRAMPEFIFTLSINWPWALRNVILH